MPQELLIRIEIGRTTSAHGTNDVTTNT